MIGVFGRDDIGSIHIRRRVSCPWRIGSAGVMEQPARTGDQTRLGMLGTVEVRGDLRRADPVYVGQAGPVDVTGQQVTVGHPQAVSSEE